MIHGLLISHEFYSTVLKILKVLPFTTLWENNKFMGLYFLSAPVIIQSLTTRKPLMIIVMFISSRNSLKVLL